MIGGRKGGAWVGHALSLAAGFVWACYSVAMRRARLDGLHAAAVCGRRLAAALSADLRRNCGATVFKAPLFDFALQAIVQGILTTIIALLLYGRMVRLLGATDGAAFVALTPAMTALMGIPLLGEWPSPIDWVAITLISIGVYAVSGGPLPSTVRLNSWLRPHTG
jgi:drug/metabolite transporter (DMT)-like permease